MYVTIIHGRLPLEVDIQTNYQAHWCQRTRFLRTAFPSHSSIWMLFVLNMDDIDTGCISHMLQVRVNPGNFADGRKSFDTIKGLTDEDQHTISGAERSGAEQKQQQQQQQQQQQHPSAAALGCRSAAALGWTLPATV